MKVSNNPPIMKVLLKSQRVSQRNCEPASDYGEDNPEDQTVPKYEVVCVDYSVVATSLKAYFGSDQKEAAPPANETDQQKLEADHTAIPTTQTDTEEAIKMLPDIGIEEVIMWVTLEAKNMFVRSFTGQPLPKVDYQPIYRMPEILAKKKVRDTNQQMKAFLKEVRDHYAAEAAAQAKTSAARSRSNTTSEKLAEDQQPQSSQVSKMIAGDLPLLGP